MEGEGMEDYGDYVTRCICDFKHDDGYMIACDGCSVWQHVECMQVDPNNLPDKYLCEICSPRPVDRRRARQIQTRKREDLSDAEDEDRVPTSQDDIQKTSSLPPILLSSLSNNSKKKKRGKVMEPPRMDVKRPKREKVEMRKLRRKPPSKPIQPNTRTSSIQSLLNAASLLEEQQPSLDIWSTNASPWSDKYDTAEHNRYSEPVRVFVSLHLSRLKSEAVVYSHEEYSTIEGRSHPVCCLSEVQRKRKGVVADMGIGEDELVIEYKGKITVKHAVLSDLAPGGKSLWKYRPCPFVYLYDKVPDLDLCIDARNYGNLARFIRRSCSPNAELRHFFVSNELHFGVYALMAISPAEEVTLAFDFRYDKCEYAVECACGENVSCLVTRSSLTSVSKKQMTKPLMEEEQLSSRSRSGSRTLLHAVAQDEDSNSSWASTSSAKKRARQSRILSPARQHSRQASREVSSDSDEDGDAPEKQITKSREERKTEAVWRMFEKMEANAQRKRQQLMSEGDSDTLSSPSTLHPSPLLSHKQLKERRSSTSSKKFQMMMPGGKMRLSSVSSTDDFPPAEFSEAILSPPMTPGFAAAPDLPYPSPHPLSLTSPPPPSTPRPEFEVTPFLHPKYLFAEFPLPWKKAILKQWEREQNASCCTNGHSLPMYNAGGGEPIRPRARGCLKHRWLKQHSEQLKSTGSGDSNKENEMENREPLRAAPLSYKKRVLLRWQESGGTDHEAPPSSAEAPPPTTSSPQAAQDQGKSPAPPPSIEPQEEAKDNARSGGNVFDYFDDFSDGEEFELVGRERHGLDELRAESGKTREGPHTPPGEEEDKSVPHPPRLEKQNSSLSIISDTSLQSSDGEMEEKEEEGKEREGGPPPTPPQAISTPANISDISIDLDQSGIREDALPKLEQSDGEVESRLPTKPSREVVTPSAAKDQGELKPEAPSSSPLPQESRVLDPASNEKEDKEQPGEARETDGKEKDGGARVDEEPSEGTVGEGPAEILEPPRLLVSHEETTGSPEKTSGLPKTPGKRKINLSEYRNRARKPAERRSSAEKSSPPHSSVSAAPLFPTLLSAPPPLLSSSYSGSLMLGTMGTLPSSGPPPVPGGVSAPSVPQFEPVSPDDGDQTPPLINMEDSSMMQSEQRQLANMMVPGITGYPPQRLMPVEQPLGQMPSSFPQQPPTAQYILDTRWNAPPMEQTQDPRRGAIPTGEMYSQPVLHGHTGDMPPGPQLMGGGDMQVLPPPMVQQQPGGYPPSHPPILHQGMMPQPHGELHQPGMMHHPDYCPRQPGPPHPHAFVPRHQPRGGYGPHRPGGNYY